MGNIQTYYDQLVALIPRLGMAFFLFFILLVAASSVRRLAQRRLMARMDDPLLARFIARLTGIAVIVFAVLLTLKIVGLGNMAIGILSTAGVGAFIVGYAFKDIGENFLAGVVLAFNRPFRIGDTVELNGVQGSVIALNLRDTQIKSFDGKDIYIPNAMVVKNPVVNYTIDGFLRLDFTLRLDYNADISRAAQIILDTVSTLPGVLQAEKAPSFAISKLAASTIDLTIYFWFNTFNQEISGLTLKNTAIEKSLNALEKEGIYLPADILELRTYKNEPLMTGTAAS